MRQAILLAMLLLVAPALAGCTKNDATPGTSGTPATGGAAPTGVNPRATINTTKGQIVADLYLEKAPITVGNFINLSTKGFYDGVKFHRIAKGFVIQGGDPNSKDKDPATWGSGGPGYKIPDEFNPTLRHDSAGILSMATAGPDTGSSQFFITLKATPSLDDRHSVFGKVVSGMDVVNAIAAGDIEGGKTDGLPVAPVTITSVTIQLPAPAASAIVHSAGLVPIVAEKTTADGRAIVYALVVKNAGTVRDTYTVDAKAPDGATVSVETPNVNVPAGTARVDLITVTPPTTGTGSYSVNITATSHGDPSKTATTQVRYTFGTLGAIVKDGSTVVANYAGFLPDGRVFDSSLKSVVKDNDIPKMATMFQDRGSYSTFSFKVASGQVIPGFDTIARGMRAGETRAGRVPIGQGYVTGSMYDQPLVNRALIFELQIVSTS